MHAKQKVTKAQLFTRALTAIENTRNDAEILEILAGYGCTTEKLALAQELCNECRAAGNRQIAAFGAQKDATVRMKQAGRAARLAYQDLSRIARAAFVRDPGNLRALGLPGGMPRTTADFISAACTLFHNAGIDGVRDLLCERGYTGEKLEEERSKITAFEEAQADRAGAKGESQGAADEAMAAYRRLADWYSEFRQIARVALRHRQKLLDKLGIPTRQRTRKSKSELSYEV
jgi:hypothetical protein